MRTFTLVSLCMLAPLSAVAAEVWQSDPQPVQYVDVHNVFSIVTYDTGYLPSSSGPLAVRFHITPSGGVVSDLHGTSHLEWQVGQDPADPEMEHTVFGAPGGWFGVDTTIDVGAEVLIDIGSVYTGTVPLWTMEVELHEGVEVDSLLLADGHHGVSVVLQDRSLIKPFAYTYSVLPGVDLVLSLEMFPQLAAGLVGQAVETDFPQGTASLLYEGEWARLPAPEGQPARLMGLSEYLGDVEAVLAFVLEPTLRVDTPIGGFTLAAFPIPVELVDRSDIRAFEPALIDHPLPAIGEMPLAHDFGERQLGSLANWELNIENLGDLALEGFARIEGPPNFRVWPEYLHATPAFDDGLVVSWYPEHPGREEAWLVLETADPGVPEVRILLSGTGLSPSADRDGDADKSRLRGSACGCASQGGAPMGLAWLLLPLLYVQRRRTSFTRR